MITKNSTTSIRQISQSTTGQSGNRNNQGRGNRGRGRGRGGRGGRGRGRGNQNPSSNNSVNSGSSTRSYSREEWQNLSQQQKNRIYRERERLETARTVAALLREENDDTSTITGRVINTTGQNAPQQNVSQESNNQATTSSGSTRSASQLSLDQAGNAFNRRRLNALITQNKRNVSRVSSLDINYPGELASCRVELDTHADTCGLNEVARVLEYSGQVVEVSGFANTMQPLSDIPIVKAAVAYDCPKTGETVILIINQGLYFGKQLSHILFNPNQLRAYNIKVNDIPKHFSSSSSHSIIIEEEKLEIPLKLKGIISYFDVRTPTETELMNCSHIILTSPQE